MTAQDSLRGSRSTDSARSTSRSRLRRAGLIVAVLAFAAAAGGCAGGAEQAPPGVILAVGAENQYANVIEQIGGSYVKVSAIESNPNVDPHAFEASAGIAEKVAAAKLVVQNGLGYDVFMQRIESAAPRSGRRVIDVQRLLGLPDSTANPHLWYSPSTMPAVARAVAADLSALQPGHAAYFRARYARFERALEPWRRALAQLRAAFPNARVATTEPVADYMLQAAGAEDLTPFGLQADIMNGVDPAPQDVSFQQGLLSGRRVQAFVYNEQVADSLTQSFLQTARSNGIPVVAVYETMPTPGYDYQSWMLAEVAALRRAISQGSSTERL